MNQFVIKRSVLSVCFYMILYYIIMELYYVHFVGISYPQFGFTLQINYIKYWETKLIFTFILIISLSVSRASEFMYAVFMLFVVFFLVPALITYSHAGQMPAPLYSIVALLVCLAAVSGISFRIPVVRSKGMSYGLIIFALTLTLVPFINQYGFYFNINNLILQDVYETRGVFDEGATTLVIYLYNWLIKAILPLLLIFFLIHKRYAYAVIPFSILVYLYVISGNKIVYITSFVMLFFYFVGKDYFGKVRYFVLALVAALAIIPLMDFYILENHTLKGTFVMRLFFLPAHLNYYYFDFFEGRPIYFAESNFVKLFVSYPYDKPVGFIIAGTYFNEPGMNANNGIISDGYLNLGYWGVALNIAIVSAVFIFFNSVRSDPRYLGIFAVMIFLFLSAPMLSMFITSGLSILFVTALTFMREDKSPLKL